MWRRLVPWILALAACAGAAELSPTGGGPACLLLDAERLTEVRARLRQGDPELRPALARLLEEAEPAAVAGPFSVMDKPFVPPSGDKHDYQSLSIYWWPNPATADGRPYVHRDGERNPEAEAYDGARLGALARHTATLALAAWLTGERRFADRAALLLRAWFLDPATRMNPHLEFGQGIPGLADGARQGVIESVPIATEILDAVGLLADLGAWTAADQAGLRGWITAYRQWLTTSRLGREESWQRNNHGTWYDVQLAAFSLYLDDRATATATLERLPRRLIYQVRDDGGLLWELGRTKSWDYSLYDLTALFDAATLAQRVDLDLWRADGVRAALDYLVGYADPAREWPHRQLGGVNRAALAPLLRRAARAYAEPAYEAALAHLPGAEAQASARWQLTDPPG